MKRHLAYLKYVLRHKLFVLVASRKTGCSLWRALMHDWSKFLPSEWLPYARCFYAPDGSKQYKESPEYAMAWLLHQWRNPHHWQAWLLRWDRGETTPIEMPEKYAREMVADWMGAGRAITGKWEVAAWYLKNKDKIQLHANTRLLVQEIIMEWQAEVMK
jgi:hypothetical protein